MKLSESTAVYTEDGTQVAVRSSLGLGKGHKVTMLIPKEAWAELKGQAANTEDMQYDVATAESIIRNWEETGAEIYWKTSADFNREARDLENHRFRNDPEVSGQFDAGIEDARSKGRQTTRSSMRAVESMTFKEYLLNENYGIEDIQDSVRIAYRKLSKLMDDEEYADNDQAALEYVESIFTELEMSAERLGGIAPELSEEILILIDRGYNAGRYDEVMKIMGEISSVITR